MKINTLKPDSKACPLCGKPNGCASPSVSGNAKSCWCMDPSIRFSEALLEKIPANLKGKACICKACVLKHQD